jgi:peptidoglycan lytic transglycosylase
MTVTKRTKTVLLALLAAAGCPPAGTGVALAGTGGTSPALARPPIRKVALATWFGPGFYGQRTACGQTLTPAVVGVANRTLPCGTLVRLSFRGRKLTLPVIDRGPYAPNGADWDLTTQAARALGMTDTARIAARVVGSVPNTPTLGVPPASQAPTSQAPTITGGAAPTQG